MSMELQAMIWLRCQARCEIVLRERSPRNWVCGEPDVLGITPARYMIEIEVKRSVSDFRADARKRVRMNRSRYLSKQPRQFYYFTTEAIAKKIEGEIPEWAGLAISTHELLVWKKAPVNVLAEKLTFKECRRMLSMLTNQVLAAETSRVCETTFHRNGNYYLNHPIAGDFQI